MDDVSKKAISRIDFLLQVGLSSNDDTKRGALSHADFDELKMLSEALKDRLPVNFHQIMQTDYPFERYKQLVFTERLKRALDFQSEFGLLMLRNSASELTPLFELNEQDRDRALHLTSQLRKIVFSSADFDQPHRRRLLDRIAAMEKELHQPKGKFDVILGGVSDFGDTMKKFGGDMKPIVDRMLELKKLTQKNASDYAQIPPPEDLPALPPPDEE